MFVFVGEFHRRSAVPVAVVYAQTLEEPGRQVLGFGVFVERAAPA